MKKGLIIGKFMPPHAGHLALIEFAAKQVDQLTIAFCSRPDEPIPGALRHKWLKRLLAHHPHIFIKHVRANLPREAKPSLRASLIWSNYMKKRFKDITHIFSSEKYGDFLATHMNAVHVPFEYDRRSFPISATEIRENPEKFYEYIPEPVHSYFFKKR